MNYVQPAQIVQVPYPLKLKAITRLKYFQAREQWKVCIIHIYCALQFVMSMKRNVHFYIVYLHFSDHRLPFQSNDFDDGVAFDSDDYFATNDERSRNEKRNGKYEFE